MPTYENRKFVPRADNTGGIGDVNLRWANGYFTNLEADNINQDLQGKADTDASNINVQSWISKLDINSSLDLSYAGDRPITASIEGIAPNFNPEATTIVEFLNAIFYPPVATNITLISATPPSFEKGVLTPTYFGARVNTGGYAVSGGVYLRNNSVEFGVPALAENISYDVPTRYFEAVDTVKHRLNINKVDGTLVTTGDRFSYAYDPFYFAALSLSDISLILDGASRGDFFSGTYFKSISDRSNKNYNYNLEDDRPCIIYPQEHGDLVSILDPNSFNILPSFIKGSFTYIRENSTTTIYNIYYLNSDSSPISNFNIRYNFS